MKTHYIILLLVAWTEGLTYFANQGRTISRPLISRHKRPVFSYIRLLRNFRRNFNQLKNGLDEIDCRQGRSWKLIPFGRRSFPIAGSSDGLESFIVASFFGKGKVVALGAEKWAMHGEGSMKQFMENAVKWMSGEDKLSSIHAASQGNSDINVLTNVTKNFLPSQLADNPPQIYFVDSKLDVGDIQVKQILMYVKNGGGLLIGGGEWKRTQQSYRDLSIGRANGYPGNKVLTKMGILIGEINQKPVVSRVVRMLPLRTNIYYAYKNLALQKNSFSYKVERNYIADVMNRFTFKMPEFQELIALAQVYYKRINPTSIKCRIKFGRWTNHVLPSMIHSGIVIKASDVAKFPYEAPDDAEKVTMTQTINGTYDGYPKGLESAEPNKYLMISTGLYAQAGEIVTVTVGKDTMDKIGHRALPLVQIGCHTDGLAHFFEVARSPDIVMKFHIRSKVTKVANPWGGLIYIMIPPGSQYGEFNVTIANAIRAPYFVHDQTSLNDWNATIRNYPAPWGELELPGQIIFSVPSSILRNYDDPQEFLEEYKKVFHLVNHLAGFENNHRPRTERIVADIQISHGYFMHPGYPIMGLIQYVEKIMDISRMRQGKAVKELHTLGCNHQHPSYMQEEPDYHQCRLYAHYINQELYGKVEHIGNPSTIRDNVNYYILLGKPFKMYAYSLAYQSLVIFLNEYGWDTWPKIVKSYFKMPQIKEKDEKLDMFARQTCLRTETNLAPFWEWWGYTLNKHTKCVCEAFPAMKRDLFSRFMQVEDPNITNRRDNCPKDWLSYGSSCFFLSEKNWRLNEAKNRCNSYGNNSHLASCFSTEEANWLKEIILARREAKHFIGIKNEDGKRMFLDGTEANITLPWSMHHQNEKNQCTAMSGQGIQSVACSSINKFICKMGPSSCGENNPKMLTSEKPEVDLEKSSMLTSEKPEVDLEKSSMLTSEKPEVDLEKPSLGSRMWDALFGAHDQ